MRFPGFIGPAYQLPSLRADCQNSVNLYLEANEAKGQANGEAGRLVPAPGLKLLATIGDGPIRGAYWTSTGRLAVVSGSKLYAVASDWTTTEIGTIGTDTGIVSMADNGNQMMLVDGSKGYIANLVDGSFQQITSEYFYPGKLCGFIDGYFTSQNPGTGQFQISALYDGLTWDRLDFGTAEGNPDPLIAHVCVNRQIWLFGGQSTEVYLNSGAADFPFTRIDGSFQEYGCGAAYSACKFAGSVAWVSNAGVVMLANGFAPQRISNHAVEYAIRQMGDFSTAYAWSYQADGHYFYVLNLGDDQRSWVYDIATGTWHERARFEDGVDKRHRGLSYAYAFGTHVVGDFENGNLYQLDSDTYTDNGTPIARERTAPHLNDQINRIFCSKFQLDFQPGVGLLSGQGSNPQVMLKVSYDGGYTFGQERWTSIGSVGMTKARAIWRRLGQGRDLVFKVRCTDPVLFTLLGAEIDLETGVN